MPIGRLDHDEHTAGNTNVIANFFANTCRGKSTVVDLVYRKSDTAGTSIDVAD
jgi:hypothetical protein